MATNIYGNGTTTATAGANTIVHYYDRAGVKAANRVNVSTICGSSFNAAKIW